MGIGRHQPEYGVCARERLVDDIDVAVRSLDHLDALDHAWREARRVARDDADGLAAVENLPEDLPSD
jgi:hypothetical protein